MSQTSGESAPNNSPRHFDQLRAMLKRRPARLVMSALLGATVASPVAASVCLSISELAQTTQSSTIGPPLTGAAFKKFAASCDGGAVVNGFGTPKNSNPHYNSSCYYWAGANQQNNGDFSTQGVSAVFSQNNPEVGAHSGSSNHSLVEIWAGSKNGEQAIEVGWIKGSGDKSPRLFATHWIDGQFEGYANSSGDTNGFVAVGNGIHVGDPVTVGATGKYGIDFSPEHNEWQIEYDNEIVGEFPESLWEQHGASFSSIGFVTVYGEVALEPDTTQPTEMGSGVGFGDSGSAFVKDYQLYNSTTPADFTDFYDPIEGQSPQYYSLHYNWNPNPSVPVTSFDYGGEGRVNFMRQEANAQW